MSLCSSSEWLVSTSGHRTPVTFFISNQPISWRRMEPTQHFEIPRKETRYSLNLPVTIWLRQESPKPIQAESDNISLRGMLFSSACPIPLGSEVSIEISLAKVTGQTDASLASSGKILRVTQPSVGEFKVAVGCDQPFQFVQREQASE